MMALFKFRCVYCLMLCFAWLICNANAQIVHIETIKCGLSTDNETLINRIAKFEASFYNAAFETKINDTLHINIKLYGRSADFKKEQKEELKTSFYISFFSSAKNQIYTDKNDDEYMKAIYFEISEAMLNANYKTPPKWLREGIAQVFEKLMVYNGEIVYAMSPERTNFFKNKLREGRLDLKAYFGVKEADWYKQKNDEYLYSVSYCLVNYFVHDDINNLQTVLTLMKQGLSTTDAITRAFGNFDRFESMFIRFYKP